MTELYFASYRLLLDGGYALSANERYLAPFTMPQLYTHTFTLHIGDEAELAATCGRADKLPLVCDVGLCRIHSDGDGWALVSGGSSAENRKVLLCSRDYRAMTLVQPLRTYRVELAGETFEIAPTLPMSTLIRCACETGMTLCGGLPLHASLVEKNGEGVIFLGRSGVGKSTQARLWRDVLDADFVIGDRPALRCIDGKWYASGMPWDGKDALYRQKTVPVRAMAALEQAKENTISRLSAQEAMAVMLNQAMLPMWDGDAMNGAYQQMAEAANTLPFWRLRCLPDGDAARLTCRTVFEGA